MAQQYKPLDNTYKTLGLSSEVYKKLLAEQAMHDAARSGLPNEAIVAEMRAIDTHVGGVEGGEYTSLQRSRVVRRVKSDTDPYAL